MRGNVAAVGEGCAHEIVLAVDAEDACRHREHVPLPGHLAAAEDGVALAIDRLDELGAGAAGRELGAAQNAGCLPEDEVVVLGVVDLGVEAERAVDALEPELGGIGSLNLQAGIADLECARRVMSAMSEQLERGGRTFDALHRRTGNHP